MALPQYFADTSVELVLYADEIYLLNERNDTCFVLMVRRRYCLFNNKLSFNVQSLFLKTRRRSFEWILQGDNTCCERLFDGKRRENCSLIRANDNVINIICRHIQVLV